jgi:uncharacterized membrane protein
MQIPIGVSAFVVAMVILLLLDAVWLTAIAPTSRRVIAGIQGTPMQIRWISAAFVYLLIAVAVVYLAVLSATNTMEAASRGALLGLALYGVYDFTNYATLTGYPLPYAIADTAWGTFLCGTAAAATYGILHYKAD